MPRRAQWIVAVFLYSAFALLALAACTRRNPELIAVTRFVPDRIAERDVLTIAGEGFVVGAEARVKFSGTVFRPAETPQKVNVEQRAVAVDAESIEILATSEFIDSFCGIEGEVSEHATFRGDVRVSFVPRLPGAPPIEGKASDVTLDVFRAGVAEAGKGATVASLGVSSHPILDFLGLEIEELGEQGLKVVNAVAGKPAYDAGVRPRDIIVAWSEVRTHRAYDLEPFPGQRLIEAKVRRESVSGTFPLVVPVEGYAPRAAGVWWIGLVLIGALVIPVLLSRSRVSKWLMWWAVSAPRAGSSVKAASRIPGLGPFLVMSLLFLALASPRRILPGELDLLWVLLAVSVATALFAVVGARHKRGFSLAVLLTHWLKQVPFHVALWGAALALVLERGRASVWELAAGQTLDPRTLGAFASPTSFCVALLFGAASATLMLCDYRQPGEGETLFWSRVNAAGRFCGDLAALGMGGLLISIFWGGWSLSTHHGGDLGFAGALAFQGRLTVLFAGFVLLRRWVPEAPSESLDRLGFRYLLPLAGVALVLLPVWGADVWPAWMKTGIQALLLTVTAVLGVTVPAALWMLRRAGSGRFKAGGLNPWI